MAGIEHDPSNTALIRFPIERTSSVGDVQSTLDSEPGRVWKAQLRLDEGHAGKWLVTPEGSEPLDAA